MKKLLLCVTATGSCLTPILSHADSPWFSLKEGDGFKRFSISAGALYVKPTGGAQPFHINTAIAEGETAKVGEVNIDTVKDSIDHSMPKSKTEDLLTFLDGLGVKKLSPDLSGTVDIYGLNSYESPGTGLKADDLVTLGIMSNYFFTDNISFESKAGIPPKVTIKGEGKIYAPFKGISHPKFGVINLEELNLKSDILVTDLDQHSKSATARAWTPAFEFQYHFGKTGVNKFRPYLGIGVMYAFFTQVEMDKGVKEDLVKAGHMIVNIKQGQAGASLEGKPAGNPKVSVKADDAFAPIVTAGFTYDINEKWFAVGSVSYASLKNDTHITVKDDQYGVLIKSKAEIEVNPMLVYAGIGFRY
ncbi:OmpW family outer membrane protein [Acinetobacter chinensis]|uniref:OmpW family outer membrane protein n=1 Tax=Acinetobacter chinensis TaxID=2004650 RepID=A0ABU3WDS7_9GAMM|nr:OmpW family outer membrane protein [Acinetobacter chinensis]MDV2468564.1 OmpW family outer membrane protein [Acinetobacter chinensis]